MVKLPYIDYEYESRPQPNYVKFRRPRTEQVIFHSKNVTHNVWIGVPQDGKTSALAYSMLMFVTNHDVQTCALMLSFDQYDMIDLYMACSKIASSLKIKFDMKMIGENEQYRVEVTGKNGITNIVVFDYVREDISLNQKNMTRLYNHAGATYQYLGVNNILGLDPEEFAYIRTRIRTTDGIRPIIRSVDTFDARFQNSFVDDYINDGIFTGHPSAKYELYSMELGKRGEKLRGLRITQIGVA